MKKVLLLVLSLVFVASLVEAKIVRDSIYQIPKTKIAPVIDGDQDPIWKVLDWNQQRIYTVDGAPADSGAGLAGLSKAMWDEQNLYILFYTIDDVLAPNPANPGQAWNQDAIELYFDGANDKTHVTTRGATQYQFTIPYFLLGSETGNLGYVFGSTFDTTGCEFKLKDVSDTEGFPGWMAEFKIPLGALGVDGTGAADQLVGWELQQDESDDVVAGRPSMSKWWSNSNSSWANPGIWGTAELSSREVDTVLEINKTTATITVDGDLDAAYQNANAVTMNLFRVDATSTDVADTDPLIGGFITAYPLWDAENYYLFLDVVDGIIAPNAANPGQAWNQDAVEIYFDGTNDHTQKTTRGATQYQFTIPYFLIGAESGNLGYVFGTTFDTTGCAYKLKDRDVRGNSGMLTQEGSGYNVEVKIPLAALGVDGGSIGEAGQPIGFELQLDNSSDVTVGRVGMEKWWSNSNSSWANPGIWGSAILVPKSGTKAVKGQYSSIISSYNLSQNYPNPFNPSTQITYSIPKNEKVRLAIYNVLGKQVAELVNGNKSAGTYTVDFSAENLSSGVYFYKLETGNTVLSKKMMLLK